MNSAVEENLTNEAVSFLNNCYLASPTHSNNYYQIEKKVSDILDKYMEVTASDVENTDSKRYKEDLETDISLYFENNNIQNDNIDSSESLSKIAFSRLAKVSKDYYMEKTFNSESGKLDCLKKLAERFKKDYELLMSLN